LKNAVGALVRMKTPIPFDAPDGQGVGLIFILMVPDRATDAHLQILSELAEMFSDKVFREQLIAASAATDLHALISNWRSHAPDQHRAAV
jgi:PTS system nitrogen regulatory IIA component